ncbi:MAG TPA: hypothetical protein PK431_16905 [Chitinophagales bacterium]|nr:hypothetical protein [Chitinophagales bacterium]
MHPEEVIRAYNGADSHMAATSRVIYTLFLEDLSAFNAFDTTMNAGFGAEFLAAIEAADVVVSDNIIKYQQVEKTETVEQVMDRARTKCADVRYFVQQTFPKSAGTQNEFGLNGYLKARKSVTKMVLLLDHLHTVCVSYQPELNVKGFSAAAIAEIDTIKTNLETAKTLQELSKKQRPKLTEERIVILNTCFKKMAQVNKAAQRVYINDYAKQHQFVYLPSQGKSKKKKMEVVPNP